jgi:zinc transport system substrate-binding protein
MKRWLIFFAFFLIVSATTMAEGSSEASKEAERELKAFVSIIPQSFFVERIGGEHVEVNVLVERGKDPHTFELTPRQMIALTGADLFFGIGFPFEQQILRKIQNTNPHLALIATDKGVMRRPMDDVGVDYERIHKNSEEKDRELHGEGMLDPHIWLSPSAIRIIVKNIYEAFSKVDQENVHIYKKNLDEFFVDLEAVNARLKKLLEPYRGKFFYVFHPAFGYFADEYGLVQIPVEIEGKSPTPKQIETLIRRARRENIKIIFVSPQFDRKSAETIAEAIGGAVISIDPLEKDVFSNLEDIAKNIKGSLR